MPVYAVYANNYQQVVLPLVTLPTNNMPCLLIVKKTRAWHYDHVALKKWLNSHGTQHVSKARPILIRAYFYHTEWSWFIKIMASRWPQCATNRFQTKSFIVGYVPELGHNRPDASFQQNTLRTWNKACISRTIMTPQIRFRCIQQGYVKGNIIRVHMEWSWWYLGCEIYISQNRLSKCNFSRRNVVLLLNELDFAESIAFAFLYQIHDNFEYGSSWLLQMMWCQIDARPSASTMLTNVTYVWWLRYSHTTNRVHYNNVIMGAMTSQMASNAENVSIRWRHHVKRGWRPVCFFVIGGLVLDVCFIWQ